MDPILAAAIRKLSTMSQDTDAESFLRGETNGKYGLDDAMRYAASIKTPSTGDILSSAIRTMAPGTPPTDLLDANSGVRALIRSGIQGATGNFADEILGKLPAFLGGGKGPEEEMRLRDELFRAQHPLIDASARGGGAAAVGLLAPEVKAATLLGGIGKGAAIGMGSTALAGAGAGEDAQSRLVNATNLPNLAVSGLLGGLIPAVTGGAQYVAGQGTGATARLARAVQQSGGAAALQAKNAEFANAGLGDVTTLGDLSDPLRAASKYAVQNSEEAAMPRIRATQARNASTPQRMMDKLREVLPQFGTDPNAPAAQDALIQATRQWASGPEGYGGLRSENPTVANTIFPGAKGSAEYEQAKAIVESAKSLGVGGSALQSLQAKADALASPTNAFTGILKQPKVIDALRRAKIAGYIGETPEPGDVPSFEKMFQLKQDVQDAADKAITAGGGKSQLGFNLKEAAKLIDEHLKANVPDYAAVSAEYGRRMGLADAFDTGKELWQTGDSRQIASALKDMTPDELHNARMAMASEAVAKLRNPTTAQSFSRQIMNAGAEGSSENALQDKLRAMFGDQQTLDGYLKFASLNHELNRMTGAYSGSDTYRNFMSGTTDPLQTGLESAAHLSIGGVKRAAVRAVAGNVLKSVRRAGAAQMAGPLMTTGTNNIADVLNALAQPRSPLVGLLSTQAFPAALSGLLGPR